MGEVRRGAQLDQEVVGAEGTLETHDLDADPRSEPIARPVGHHEPVGDAPEAGEVVVNRLSGARRRDSRPDQRDQLIDGDDVGVSQRECRHDGALLGA